MSTLEAIVLGIVQGLTEFLPISSTGHLRIVPAFVGWDDPGAAFTAVIQLGTMAAVLVYFRGDLWRIGRAWLLSVRERRMRHDLDARLGWYIVLATIPIGLFGLAFKDQIENGARDLSLIGSALISIGLVMAGAELASTRKRDVSQITARDGWWIGVAQALALIPGVSRSGATISAGLFLGLDRASAARFSFLLSVPAVVLSGLLELATSVGDDREASAGALVISTALAFVVGYASIAFLLRFLVTHTVFPFVAYRVALGAAVLALVAAGAIG